MELEKLLLNKTLVTSSLSDEIENEAHDIVMYNYLKRALLAKLTKYNSVKRALTADCSGNLNCMVWGKRALTEKKNKHKRFVSNFDKYFKKDLATTNLLKKDFPRHDSATVSYTHLTLPTTPYV